MDVSQTTGILTFAVTFIVALVSVTAWLSSRMTKVEERSIYNQEDIQTLKKDISTQWMTLRAEFRDNDSELKADLTDRLEGIRKDLNTKHEEQIKGLVSFKEDNNLAHSALMQGLKEINQTQLQISEKLLQHIAYDEGRQHK